MESAPTPTWKKISELDAEEVAKFRKSLLGRSLLRDTHDDKLKEAFEHATTPMNRMIAIRPGLVVFPTGVADVIASVKFARKHSIEFGVRGGGHSTAPRNHTEGGILLALEDMKHVEVDPKRKTAKIAGGATLREVDHETTAFGLALPVGTFPPTGIALVLQGGFGMLTNLYGMSVDSILSVDLVDYRGELVHASAEENADLFWGLCGAAPNFGVVTSLEVQLYPVPDKVLGGLFAVPSSKAGTYWKVLRDLSDADNRFAFDLGIFAHPALPQEAAVAAICYAAPEDKWDEVLKQLHAVSEPLLKTVGPRTFEESQSSWDPLMSPIPPFRMYWTSEMLKFDLTEEDYAEILDKFLNRPDFARPSVILQSNRLKTKRKDNACVVPDSFVTVSMIGMWPVPDLDAPCMSWIRGFVKETLAKHKVCSYINASSDVDSREVYLDKRTQRLAEIKAKWDPHNFFHCNQNVHPKEGS